MMKNIFDAVVVEEIVKRINQLTPETKPLWGKMSVAQMLADSNVSYAFNDYPERFTRPNALKKWLLKTFVKPNVVSDKSYKKNSPTAPVFLIKETKDFNTEKQLLIDNIRKTQQIGGAYFEKIDNFSFGKMTIQEWNNMFYKHLDHHLTQFGV